MTTKALSPSGILQFLVILTLATSLGACSHRRKTRSAEAQAQQDEKWDKKSKKRDAGTDAVPANDVERLEANTNEGFKPSSKHEPDAVDAGPAFEGTGKYEKYVVQEGDTLMKIAFEHYGNLYHWKAIADANRGKVSNPNSIPQGTILQVEKSSSRNPASDGERVGDKYMIKKGDTLGTISSEVYGTPKKWKRLWEQNKTLIKNPDRIFAGFYVYYALTAEEQQAALSHPAPRSPSSSAPPAPAGVTPPPPPAAAAAR